MNQQGNEFEGAKLGKPDPTVPSLVPSPVILKEIRSWAISLLVLGAISIFAAGYLSAAWGILMIAVGLASFYFRSSAMMAVYAVTLVWAAINNAMTGQIFWIGFAVFQAFLTLRVFLKFLSFRRAEAEPAGAEPVANGLTPQRSASVFPWAAGVLGVFSLLGLAGIFAAAILLAMFTKYTTAPAFLGFVEGLVINCGVLGLALGLASLLCKHPRKAVSIVGMVTGTLTLLLEITLAFV